MGSERVKFLGSTDDVTTCEHCGKSALKGTIALEIDGSVVYFGSTCASRALAGRGIEASPATIRRETKNADEARRDAENKAREAVAAAARDQWFAWLKAKTGKSDVFCAIESLGGYAAARALHSPEVQS